MAFVSFALTCLYFKWLFIITFIFFFYYIPSLLKQFRTYYSHGLISSTITDKR